MFWIGVYPGLTQPMLTYVVEAIRDFVQRAETTGISRQNPPSVTPIVP
jgi:hypothetical protein